MRRKGISLIVLIVTIIVIIILAAAVILTITKNSPIESAKEATFKEDVRSFQDDLALTVSKQYVDLQGKRDEKITTSNFAKMKGYIPSFTEKYKDKFAIEDDQLVGTLELTEKENNLVKELNIKILDYTIFDAEEWDKEDVVTPQDCFKWGSNVESEDGYDVIIGYNSTLQNYPRVRIPSRCRKIICDGSYYTANDNSDEQIGRAFLSNINVIEIPGTVNEIGYCSFSGLNHVGANSVKEVKIAHGVKYIGKLAFRDCSNLSNINIPKSVTTINEQAFAGCSGLKNIVIPSTVTNIESDAFAGCSDLTNVVILSGITGIKSGTFASCSNLASITIPDSVTSIEDFVFAGCSKLVNITFNGTREKWDSITKTPYWCRSSSITTIICTDGEITL